ncbi:hypothetical protein D3C77_462260 [compost metagenome]
MRIINIEHKSIEEKFEGIDVLINLLNSKPKLKFFIEKHVSISGLKSYCITTFDPKSQIGEKHAERTITRGEIKAILKNRTIYIDIVLFDKLMKSMEFKESDFLDEFLFYMENDLNEVVIDLIKNN